MGKTKSSNYELVNNIRIYTLNYLSDGDLQESDLESLINKENLTYSLIVNMFKYAGYKFKPINIIDMIKTDNKWLDKYTWTHKQLLEYELILKKIFYNIYRYKDAELKSYVQWFIIQYGLSVKN